MYTQNTDLQASDIAADTTDDVTADSSDDGAADISGVAVDTNGDAADVTDIPEAPAHADVTDVAEIEDIEAAAEASQAKATDAAEAAEAAESADVPKPPAMRILRIKDCASLSGRSILTYQIGIRETASNASTASIPEIYLRLYANTAKGYFCKDWISMGLVEVVLSEPFTSRDVQRLLFEGKSINSGGFVLAALRNEGLIRAIPTALRRYEGLEPSEWQQEIAALIEAGVSLAENAKPMVAKEIAASIAATAASVFAKSGKARPAPVASKAPIAFKASSPEKARSPKKASKS